MFKKKILIIDDSELMVKLISDILKEKNYDVVSASNGLNGIKKVAEEKPDLVILDVVMPGIDGFEVCKMLRDDESNNLMPIIILTAQDNEEDKLTGLDIGADDYITKPFNPRELISRVHNTLLRIDRNRWANPLTGLKGNIEIQTEINYRIAKGKPFAVIYADLDNFKAYNDIYGFANGDRVIKLTADIILDNVHIYGTPGDFIGHIGGDDFVIVTLPDCAAAVCKGIIESFDKKILTLYSVKDRERGYILTTNRQGSFVRYPITAISLAIVTNECKQLSNHLQVAELAAEVKKKAKELAGSVFVKDMGR